MQSKSTALLIGRFQPFHIGHLDGLLKILEKYKMKILDYIIIQYH